MMKTFTNKLRPGYFNVLVIDYSDLQESRGEALKIKIKKIKRNFKITLKLLDVFGLTFLKIK